MNAIISRRAALATLMTAAALPALGAAAAAPAAAAPPVAADRPHVKSDDPIAKALGYVDDAGRVDAKTNPTFKPGSQCTNCAQNTGPAGSAWVGCNLFPGKTVNAKGWCRVWVKKP